MLSTVRPPSDSFFVVNKHSETKVWNDNWTTLIRTESRHCAGLQKLDYMNLRPYPAASAHRPMDSLSSDEEHSYYTGCGEQKQ